MLRSLLVAAALTLPLAANAQSFGQPAPGTPCVITALEPSNDAGPNMFFCGDHAFALPSALYSNVSNPSVWEAVAAGLGHMVTATVSALGTAPLPGTTGMIVYVDHVKIQ